MGMGYAPTWLCQVSPAPTPCTARILSDVPRVQGHKHPGTETMSTQQFHSSVRPPTPGHGPAHEGNTSPAPRTRHARWRQPASEPCVGLWRTNSNLSHSSTRSFSVITHCRLFLSCCHRFYLFFIEVMESRVLSTISRQGGVSKNQGVPPLPPPFLPSLPFPSLPFPSRPLPLELGPLNFAKGSGRVL